MMDKRVYMVSAEDALGDPHALFTNAPDRARETYARLSTQHGSAMGNEGTLALLAGQKLLRAYRLTNGCGHRAELLLDEIERRGLDT